MLNKNEEMFTEYQYGFSDKDVSIFKTEKGLTKEIVETISKRKEEPQWMLDFRLNALKEFYRMPMPTWGGDLSEIDFEDLTYYVKPSEKTERSWDEVPTEIKNTFEKLGIPEAEQKYLAGVSAQYESEVVYHNMHKQFEEQGIIFEDTDTALKNHEEIFKKLIDYVEENYSKEQLTIQKSLSGYLEITHINAKKSKGIEYIQKLEKLEKNELAAFGDGQNDIPMFESVGHIVVMENATDDVKKYADFITKSNNDDGVAYAIDKYIKNI